MLSEDVKENYLNFKEKKTFLLSFYQSLRVRYVLVVTLLHDVW